MQELWDSEQPRARNCGWQGAIVAPSRSTFSKVTSSTALLAGPCLMTASAAARFVLRCSPPTFPGGAPRGGGRGSARGERCLGARRQARRTAGMRAAARGRDRASLSPELQPQPGPAARSLPAPLSEPAARVAAEHGGPCGVSLRWLQIGRAHV